MITLAGVAVALGGAAAWAGFDAARKRVVASLDPISAAAWINLAQGPIFLAWALATSLRLEADYVPVGAAVLLLQVAANVLLFRALSVSALSTVIPMLALTPVFSSLVGVVVLHEYPEPLQWLGIGLVVTSALGVYGRDLKSERGALLALSVALIWSVTTTLDKLALEHASLPLHAAVQTGGVGVVLVLGLWLRGSLSRPREVGAFAGAVVLGTSALALQLWAIQLLFVGLVETIKRAVGLLSALVLGRALFAEAITARLVLGVLGLIAGTILLVFG